MRNLLFLLPFWVWISCTPSSNGDQLISLRNDHVQILAKPIGAELVSIKLLEDGTEYLWQGDSTTWADHAIVQFPFIGNLKNGEYQFEGKTYPMMSHGFARISEFQLVEQTKEKGVFELQANDATRKRYPFDFRLRISYSLEGKSINIGFEVFNEGQQEMYFSLGYHPGFNWPLQEGESMEAYYLEFSDPESANRLIMSDNLIDSIHYGYLTDTETIQLEKSLFQQDAIMLEGIQSNSLSLKNMLNPKSITVDFGKVPYLGIWSPKERGQFVCIEPWFGIPDERSFSGNLPQKKGIMALPAQDSFSWRCKITLN